MEKGSHVHGILGALGGVLIALLAIVIGAGTVLLFGTGEHGPHSTAVEHQP
ncbi:MAG: hypothetical protein ACE5I7_08370 [Candidatus Binatia bacterium]